MGNVAEVKAVEEVAPKKLTDRERFEERQKEIDNKFEASQTLIADAISYLAPTARNVQDIKEHTSLLVELENIPNNAFARWCWSFSKAVEKGARVASPFLAAGAVGTGGFLAVRGIVRAVKKNKAAKQAAMEAMVANSAPSVA
jgi:hypothetical protein